MKNTDTSTALMASSLSSSAAASSNLSTQQQYSDSTVINFDEIPLSALSNKCRSLLSTLLDPKKALPSEDGLQRDWRGLFILSGLPKIYEPQLFKNSRPTIELIQLLVEVFEDKIYFSKILEILDRIDRLDVLDDTRDRFVEDAKEYLQSRARKNHELCDAAKSNNSVKKSFSTDQHIITVDDRAGQPLTQYNAFVLFDDEDINFATDIIEQIEGFGLKVCVKDRDLLGGLNFEHDAIRKLLTERCDRLVVVVSAAFIASPHNEFISNLAQSLGIAQRTRKIIPCSYGDCDELPEIFRHVHVLNYKRSLKFANFWDKLYSSLLPTPEEMIGSSIKFPRITISSDISSSESNLASPQPIQNSTVPSIIITESQSSPATTPSTNRKIFPPKGILRPSPSMHSIYDPTDEDTATDTSMNSNTLDPLPKKKKTTWYKKLLTPSNSKKKSSSTNDLSASTKKNFFKKSKRLFRIKKQSATAS